MTIFASFKCNKGQGHSCLNEEKFLQLSVSAIKLYREAHMTYENKEKIIPTGMFQWSYIIIDYEPGMILIFILYFIDIWLT